MPGGEAHFLREIRGEKLACAYAAADVFGFPSRTHTFGNVLLEALGSGLPVAAFPVLDDDLGKAARSARLLPRSAARDFALGFTWQASGKPFRHKVLVAHGVGEAAMA